MRIIRVYIRRRKSINTIIIILFYLINNFASHFLDISFLAHVIIINWNTLKLDIRRIRSIKWLRRMFDRNIFNALFFFEILMCIVTCDKKFGYKHNSDFLLKEFHRQYLRIFIVYCLADLSKITVFKQIRTVLFWFAQSTYV